ncbi:hypothetical protein BDW74DRAFT_5513 [Aspergillus multicolor]|uniref:uncharacterized protein n=1 Tax=Aspergillus multicolor TaxID=41759 RepID=UPI003CCC9041
MKHESSPATGAYWDAQEECSLHRRSLIPILFLPVLRIPLTLTLTFALQASSGFLSSSSLIPLCIPRFLSPTSSLFFIIALKPP